MTVAPAFRKELGRLRKPSESLSVPFSCQASGGVAARQSTVAADFPQLGEFAFMIWSERVTGWRCSSLLSGKAMIQELEFFNSVVARMPWRGSFARVTIESSGRIRKAQAFIDCGSAEAACNVCSFRVNPAFTGMVHVTATKFPLRGSGFQACDIFPLLSAARACERRRLTDASMCSYGYGHIFAYSSM